MNDFTDPWKYYEAGRQYNNSLQPSQYNLVHTNTEFFNGNQWINIPESEAMARLPKPTFNIIARIAQTFVASLTSSGTTIRFDPLSYADPNSSAIPAGGTAGGQGVFPNEERVQAATLAEAEVRNLLEKFKMDYRIRDALFDGAITGDYCAHFRWNPDSLPYGGEFGPCRGEIEMEMVDGINVMFGNPSVSDVEKQPYIVIVGRETVRELKEEYTRRNGGEGNIQPDGFSTDYGMDGNFSSGMDAALSHQAPDEDSRLCTFIYLYRKVTRPIYLPYDNYIPSIDESHFSYENNIPTFCGNKLFYENDIPLLSKSRLSYANDIPPLSKSRLSYENDISHLNKSRLSYANDIPNHIDSSLSYDNDNPQKERSYLSYGNDIPSNNEGRLVYVNTILVTKATRNAVIFENVDTGLSRYPIAWGNWEKMKHRYHGKALVTGIVPNQIYINTMMAMVFRSMMTQSFPKVLFNADVLPRYNNEVGTAIGVRNLQPEQKLDDVVSSIRPADLSSQIMLSIDKCMQYTKECLGATDAQMGTANANNTSAIMVLQNASEVPLENIRAGLHEWLEDIGAILLDMMGTYYGERPILVPNPDSGPPANSIPLEGDMVLNPQTMQMENGKPPQNVLTLYDFRKFKNLWMSVSADVGATNYYSEIATVQTLDNLRKDGFLSAIDYLERIPDKLIPRKQELIDELKGQSEGINVQSSLDTTKGGGKTNESITMGAPSLKWPLRSAEIASDSRKTSEPFSSFKSDPHGRSVTRRQLRDSTVLGSDLSQIPQRFQAQYDKLPSVAQRALVRANM